MRVGEVMEYAVDQVVTRQDHMDGLGLGQYMPSTAKVKPVQEQLLKLGYPIGQADGILGEKTIAAIVITKRKINSFYKASKFAENGTVDDPNFVKELETGNKEFAATLEDKAKVQTSMTPKGGRGGASTALAVKPTAAAPAATAPPAAVEKVADKPAAKPAEPAAGQPVTSSGTSFKDYMNKVTEYVKANPAVAAGAGVVVLAGLYLLFKPKAAAPVEAAPMMGLAEWDMPKPKRKKRRKSRKSKK